MTNRLRICAITAETRVKDTKRVFKKDSLLTQTIKVKIRSCRASQMTNGEPPLEGDPPFDESTDEEPFLKNDPVTGIMHYCFASLNSVLMTTSTSLATTRLPASVALSHLRLKSKRLMVALALKPALLPCGVLIVPP
jgi:ABC-type glycerol-3-phosphate transport system permease component